MFQYANIQTIQAIELQEAQKIGRRGHEFIPNIHKKIKIIDLIIITNNWTLNDKYMMF